MKKIKILGAILLLSSTMYGQSFLKAVPKPHQAFSVSLFDSAVVSPPAKTMTAFRPVFNEVTYTIPDNTAQVGIGVAYQWLKYDEDKKAWSSTVSINALLQFGAKLDDNQKAVYAGGVSIGFFNNLLAPGYQYNFALKSRQFVISTNINFNNK